MRLGGDFKKDIKALQQMRLPWWGVLIWMGVCALIVWPFYRAGRLDLARPVLWSVGILGVLTAIKRKLKRHVWFWVTMAILASLHVLLILLVPWPSKWIPALVAIPFGIADVYIMLWLVSVVGTFMGARNH